MPRFLIHKVGATLLARLKTHAAAHRRSVEEDVCELLRTGLARQAATPRENLVDIARRLFGLSHGVELDIPPRGRGQRRQPLEFSGAEFGQ